MRPSGGCCITAITPAFQAGDVGSTPIIRFPPYLVDFSVLYALHSPLGGVGCIRGSNYLKRTVLLSAVFPPGRRSCPRSIALKRSICTSYMAISVTSSPIAIFRAASPSFALMTTYLRLSSVTGISSSSMTNLQGSHFVYKKC